MRKRIQGKDAESRPRFPGGIIGGVAGWQRVASTAVEAYRWQDGLLELRFVDNPQIYEYPCDDALLARFLAAESKGTFVNRVLKPLEQRARTRAQFALQSRTFESRDYLFTDEGILGWIEAHAPVRGDDRILDVAGGTGALGRHLVRSAASCVVLDLVPEMLARGAAHGDRDVLYVQGDATEMPFADSQFDLLVSRFAVHHFDDPAAVFREMERVGVPGARVVVIDMVDGGARHNELERLRDPSHTSALSRERLVELLRDAGFEGAVVAEREHTMDASRWLSQAHGTPGPVEAALRAEAQGGPPTGLHARLVGGALQITQVWVILAGTAGQGLEPQLPEPESGVLPITPPGKGAGRAV
jgi:SAM-dependent methyltransferase